VRRAATPRHAIAIIPRRALWRRALTGPGTMCRQLPAWPYLSAQHGVPGVSKSWRRLVAAAPELVRETAVLEAPVAAGLSHDERSTPVAPVWARGFTQADLPRLNAAVLFSLSLHDVRSISFGQALCFSAQCLLLQRLSLERLGNGVDDGSGHLRGEDLEVPLQACEHLTSVRIVSSPPPRLRGAPSVFAIIVASSFV